MVLERAFATFPSREHTAEMVSPQTLGEHIDYFDRHWETIGIPHNWDELPGIGFSMNRQMRLLSEIQDLPTWFSQTRMDILGFSLEYLKEGLVFPFEYAITENASGRREVVDVRYGNRKIVDTVAPEERGGAVRDALHSIESFFLFAPDGAIAVMVSPEGPSGLREDNGKDIAYVDSQTYIMQKQGDRILGLTIRTDFSKKEHAAYMQRFGQKYIHADTDLADFVRSVSFLVPQRAGRIPAVEDVLTVMQQVRGENPPYKNRSWEHIFSDVQRRDTLYSFGRRVDQLITDFGVFLATDDNLSENRIRKALAATILRLSKLFVVEEHVKADISSTAFIPMHDDMSFGAIYQEIESRPGCAGGGSEGGLPVAELILVIESVTMRLGRMATEAKFSQSQWFICPRCDYHAIQEVGNKCPKCNLHKDEAGAMGYATC